MPEDKKTEEYCFDCLKYDQKDGKCVAFKELFHRWNTDHEECWGRETDPVKWLKTLEDIEDHFEVTSGENLSGTQKRWEEYAAPQREKMRELIGIITSQDIAEVYKEDMKRGKGGGGEKNKDGSAFGPQQMKDNRFQHRKLRPKHWNGWH